MNNKIKYSFIGKLWKYDGPAGWYFISLPEEISKAIREQLQWQEEGWGRMKATASVKDITWDTAIWFDKKQNTYLLPIKAAVRNNGELQVGVTYATSIYI